MVTLISPRIRRITMPYKDIYTSVFILDTPEGTVLFDTAFSDYDVDTYILPELRNRNIRYIFISHNHRDHAWGLPRLLEVYPEAVIVTQNKALAEQYAKYTVLCPNEGDMLLDTYQVVNIPGHTADSQGLLEPRNGILFTGDGLQAYGIYGEGQWGACIRAIPEHLAALQKLRALPLTDVLMAHDYHPFGNEVYGTEEIHNCLDACAAALLRVKEVLLQNPGLSDQQIADLCNRDSGLPTVPAFVPEAIRAAVAEGTF
jgi:glyoxylase-like metal-dependent hydrolase (beta-lactamase superfamily II)